MDCRETRTLLTAFHDGELPAADRARVEEHLRGCPGCVALLADLARADQAAGVPDPGPAYWDRFNARVMDRVERKADGPRAAVLRPKHGWMRQSLRYLAPAAAAAALVVGIVRYGGMHPGAPVPTGPPSVRETAPPVSAGQRTAKAEPESDGQGWPGAGAGRDATGSVAPARGAKKAESAAVARRVPPPAIANERYATVTREERDRLADRSPRSGNEEASRDRAAAPAGSPPVTAADGMLPGMEAERKRMEGAVAPMAEQQAAGKAKSASGMRSGKEPSPDGQGRPSAGAGRDATGSVAPAGSPCELARTLAERERFREAEVAQRACLAGDLDPPSREKGLVFLAELLDRQTRFAEADDVIAEVDRRYPQSRPLDLYRQQRPMVQKQPAAVPVTR